EGVVTLYLPAGTTHLGATHSSDTGEPLLSTQNGLTTLNFYALIPADGTATATLQVVLPAVAKGDTSFTVVPTPRINPTGVAVQIAP
ncbi:MAG: hypothetical protein ACRDYC_09280, partial [Acidimicrobiales bacterium]